MPVSISGPDKCQKHVLSIVIASETSPSCTRTFLHTVRAVMNSGKPIPIGLRAAIMTWTRRPANDAVRHICQVGTRFCGCTFAGSGFAPRFSIDRVVPGSLSQQFLSSNSPYIINSLRHLAFSACFSLACRLNTEMTLESAFPLVWNIHSRTTRPYLLASSRAAFMSMGSAAVSGRLPMSRLPVLVLFPTKPRCPARLFYLLRAYTLTLRTADVLHATGADADTGW